MSSFNHHVLYHSPPPPTPRLMRAHTYGPQLSRCHQVALTLTQSFPRSVWVKTANGIKYHSCDEMLHGNREKILGGLTYSGETHLEAERYLWLVAERGKGAER